MTRRASRITHDEVTRMVKAVRDLGLPIARVVFNGVELSVVIGGDNGEKPPHSIANDETPKTFETLEDYLSWRDRSGAGEDHGHS